MPPAASSSPLVEYLVSRKGDGQSSASQVRTHADAAYYMGVIARSTSGFLSSEIYETEQLWCSRRCTRTPMGVIDGSTSGFSLVKRAKADSSGVIAGAHARRHSLLHGRHRRAAAGARTAAGAQGRAPHSAGGRL